MSQITLHFKIEADYSVENFILSSCNQLGYKLITGFPSGWNSHITYLHGARGSGKTHLASIWQNIAGAEFFNLKTQNNFEPENYIVEDIEDLNQAAEEKLFHLLNNAKNSNKYILITSEKPVLGLGIKLPDLRSRLSSANIAYLKEPDDELLKAMLLKNFSDRQILVSNDVLDFLLNRTERSFEAITSIINLIDFKSFEQKRKITIPFIKEILGL
jgi:DnaA regulatory inactivator Hda